MMAGIGPANTKPEMLIRRGLHALGYRYRLHAKRLPGKPDMVFPGRRAAIFVNGCFWHGHDRALFRWPATREDFWRYKIAGNINRDRKTAVLLIDQGWWVLDIWEFMLKGRTKPPLEDLLAACAAFLNGNEIRASIGSDQTVTVVASA